MLRLMVHGLESTTVAFAGTTCIATGIKGYLASKA